MKTIGLMGTETINNLFKEVVGDSYAIIDLDFPGNSNGSIGNRVSRLVYFLKKLKAVDLVYFTYIRENTGFLARVAKIFGKKVIYHWAGSDVLNYVKGSCNVKKWNPSIDLHLAYAPNLKIELGSIGIDSEVFTIVPKLKLEAAAMPREHAILLSIPDDEPGRAEFYGYTTLVKVIQKFPNLTFYVTRSTHPEMYPFPNVIFEGLLSWEQMDSLYDLISIVIRFPEHDGLSLLLMESTIKGKYMIYNFNLPYTTKATTFDEICAAIESLLLCEPRINKAASEYGVENYNQVKCLKEACKYIDSILNKE